VTQARLWLSQHAVHYPGTKDDDLLDAHMLTMRLLHPLHLEQETDMPTYEREERLHCTNRTCQNVYTLPEAWEAWEQIRQAKEWQRHPERLPAAVRDQHLEMRQLQQAIAEKLATLHCPLCAAAAPRRATIVWVRRFVRRVESCESPP